MIRHFTAAQKEAVYTVGMTMLEASLFLAHPLGQAAQSVHCY